MTSYTTKQGDMWDSIALSQYGTDRFTDTLMMANTGYIGTHIFPAGVVLNIPDVDLDDPSSTANLPPWKVVI